MQTPEQQTSRIPEADLDGVTELVLHASCPDGLAAGLILKDAFPEAKLTFVAHNTPEHQAEPRVGTLWCDMSPPPDKAEAWREAGAIVLDHHLSAQATVETFGDRGVFAHETHHPGVSGALLAYLVWERLRPESPQGGPRVHDMGPRVYEFATVAGIRDTWQQDHPRFREACEQAAALMLFGDSLLDGHPPWLSRDEVRAGAALYAQTQRRALEVAEQAPIANRALIFNDGGALRLTSDVAEHARELGLDCDLVVGFFYVPSGDLVLSMRSVADDFDVSAIAKRIGGGGHTKAAGAVIRAEDAAIRPYALIAGLLQGGV